MPLLEPSAKAPDFTLPDQAGAAHSLKDYRGRPVIVYFYPKDDTPGCTIEACAFRDLMPMFKSSEAAIFGVSPDDVASHAAFVKKFDLNFTLLADAPPKPGQLPRVCDAYGVWQEKMMYGRPSMGVARTTYLIDGAGKVARRWDKVNVKGHAEEVLKAVNEIT